MVTLALCQRVLAELTVPVDGTLCGSARIHGGGFGGTIQVVVPNDKVEPFVERIESLLGIGACMLVKLGAPGHQGRVRRRMTAACRAFPSKRVERL